MPPNAPRKALRILGTRGVPAAHGGFETFAERLALYLLERGWEVTVYCQAEGQGTTQTDAWRGVQRVTIAVPGNGAVSTMRFDWRATLHAAAHRDLCLTLGYNTALFCAWLRLRGVANLINMDGVEWHRAKWGKAAKTWFWINELAGCWLGDHLIADHPAIQTHLQARVPSAPCTVIAYGADEIEQAPVEPIQAMGLVPGRYWTVIARPEPENSILPMVQAFSARPRGCRLVILGQYSDRHPYHRAVREAASDEVMFPGAIYDKAILHALRRHAMGYLHGHTVGGTSPTLVEAMGAGNAVVALDNVYNRWVAGPSAVYFRDAQDLALKLDALLGLSGAAPDEAALESMRAASRQRVKEEFTWPIILSKYETLLLRHLP